MTSFEIMWGLVGVVFGIPIGYLLDWLFGGKR